MSGSILTTARKELRAYFLSPVALIFLAVFLAATLFIFFTHSRFFARNLADVRPLFDWLPLLLIFLVSALTMRQWSEEQKMGTLELLLTLPLRTRDLVLGKFTAGMALVALALLLTLPLPITVALLGDLDWGPVIGGYAAALLLASTYMAIGLCVSARTDNQIVALLVTGILGALLYLVGADAIVGFFGHEIAEILRQIGSGSRFASVSRGVLDLRDLAYYASLTGFFLTLNVYFLEAKRAEKQPKAGGAPLRRRLIGVTLIGLNVIALNLWLAGVTRARVDLTEGGEYSVSAATQTILDELDEPLTIDAFFSEKTHPKLAPLIPRIRDFLTEYQVRGAGRVQVRFADPNTDKDLQEEIGEQYDIKSIPLHVEGRDEESVINAYFHILIRYGGEYQILKFGDLIEIQVEQNDIVVRLRNLEYDITRAIKKTTQGFQSIPALLARAERPFKLTAYISSADKLPEQLKEVPSRVNKVAEEIAEESGGKFSFEMIDPDADRALQAELAQKYGMRPVSLDLFGEQQVYLYLLFDNGAQKERLFLQGEMTEASVREAIEASVKRSAPGFLKTIGLFSAEGTPPQQPQFPGMPAQPGTPADFRALEQQLAETFTVKRLNLKDGVVPSDVDVLIIAKPDDLDDKQQLAIDQYLMRGGAVIALTGYYTVRPDRQGLKPQATPHELIELLAHYGVRVEPGFVMDPVNTRFPVPVQERRGNFVLERIKMMAYPLFPDIRKAGFKEGHVALAGLQNVALTWASALKLEAPQGVNAEVLLRTSEGSWVRTSEEMNPDPNRYPEMGFEAPKARGAEAVAVAAHGTFTSYFNDKDNPLEADQGSAEEQGQRAGLQAQADIFNAFGGARFELPKRKGQLLTASTPDARLVVIGSGEFASDLITQLAMQPSGALFRSNPLLVRNLIDWSLEDTDLLQIRSAGAFARTLKPTEAAERREYEWSNYALTLIALLAVLGLAVLRRRMIRPLV
ncbi:Gldg family protein [Myxococcota bacterium]|nr:Gldg family protein [Myxococcota bacterium]MBU1431898.1 Gldg family protein [Myxococcota bacterium]MBU1900477.1 Gldg family protein [Myxococcota bacterium]